MATEMRKSFHHKLEDVRQEVVLLGGMVIELIPQATDVLLGGDLAQADAIINNDDVVDAKALLVEDESISLLALQQPMAADLRRVVTALKLAGEIERSADLCVNLCKAARRLYGRGAVLGPKLRGLITQMSDEAQRLYRTAVEAYAKADNSLAAAVKDMDDLLDQVHRRFIRTLIESHAETNIDLESAVQLALVGRFYERIGDHAVNIGERVQYMVTGWLPERVGAARAAGAEATAGDAAPGADVGEA